MPWLLGLGIFSSIMVYGCLARGDIGPLLFLGAMGVGGALILGLATFYGGID
jgi:hypothetical protein